jgi:hypothetical protein
LIVGKMTAMIPFVSCSAVGGVFSLAAMGPLASVYYDSSLLSWLSVSMISW